ncbi:hypothetical protein DN555_02170 [Enterobacter asburiae]|nr:hypothetical protein MC67_02900 [Enterobacter cloacae complex sp.]POV40271.1 hypothetical protein C3394_13415 [Enterobacter cloacae complex sp. ECNIH11]POV42380.1 hypothetical protein C3397_16730 [Enterobacter cloacae complex sp. ECNIH16]RWT17252.1 hypothetical protein DN555_02170 [Enterobacter asburiae]TYG22668.1 hypothetical protein DJ541_03885 [Enterobacter asburiae]
MTEMTKIANTSKKMSKYFTLLPVMWFKRIKCVQFTAISLINYHFSDERETEKVTRRSWIYGQNAEYQPSGVCLVPFGNFFFLFWRWR